jgi:L-threonylcarbamoyladenylate synthase
VLKNAIASFKVNSENSDALSGALAALRRGDVIVFPTETLYGLGADALAGTAVEKVFQLKGRDSNNPLPVLIADFTMLERLVLTVPRLAKDLMDCFWPGPLTLVLPARNDIPKPLVNATGGIGVRISSQPVATRLVRLLGHPITATSANPSGQEPARTLDEARNYFTRSVEVFVDGGALSSKRGSTVVEATETAVRIIRQGEIAAVELERVLGARKVY